VWNWKPPVVFAGLSFAMVFRMVWLTVTMFTLTPSKRLNRFSSLLRSTLYRNVIGSTLIPPPVLGMVRTCFFIEARSFESFLVLVATALVSC